MNENFEAKHELLGPEGHMKRSIVVLNRTIRWESTGITIEADVKHQRKIVEALGLEDANPVKTPAIQDETADEENMEETVGRRLGQYTAGSGMINLNTIILHMIHLNMIILHKIHLIMIILLLSKRCWTRTW